MFQVDITIQTKKGVLDVESSILSESINNNKEILSKVNNDIDQRISEIKNIKISKKISFTLDINNKKVAESIATTLCSEILVNSFIEEYEVSINKL